MGTRRIGAIAPALLCAGLVLAQGPACAAPTPEDDVLRQRFDLKSRAVLVVDEDSGETLAARNADAVVPVASLTKLMTALVVLEAGQPLDEVLEITLDDVDDRKHTPSRLHTGAMVSRDNLLLLALMASENRAAMALSRNFPGGRLAFVAHMNRKAQALGMHHTRFADPTGLSRHNVSSARDLYLLLNAADAEPRVRDYSTRRQHTLHVGRRKLTFLSSNRLVRGDHWDIAVQKTGFTNEAGRCLVMRATVAGRSVAMIFLNSWGTLTRYADAARVRRALERRDPARHAGVVLDAS